MADWLEQQQKKSGTKPTPASGTTSFAQNDWLTQVQSGKKPVFQQQPVKKTEPIQTKQQVKVDNKGAFDGVFNSLSRVGKSFAAGLPSIAGQFLNTGGIVANKASQAITNEREKVSKGDIIPGYQFGIADPRRNPLLALSPKGTEKALEQKSKELKAKGDVKMKESQAQREKLGKPSGKIQWLAEEIAYTTPSFLTSFGIGAAATVISKNPALGVSLGFSSSFAQSAGQAYQEAKDYGVSEKKAEDVGSLTGVAVALVEQLPLGRVLNRTPQGQAIKKKLISEIGKSFVKQGLLEGTTESIQQVIQNAIAKTYNENQDLFAGIGESGIVGFFMGGAAGSAVDIGIAATGKSGQTIENANTQIKEAFDTKPENRTPLQKQIVSAFLEQNITPQQASQMVVGNNLGDTEIGRTIMKVALQAQEQGKNITIKGTEDGSRIDVELADRLTLDQTLIKQSAETLVAKAEQVDADFKSKVDTVAKELQMDVKHGPIKKTERIIEKLHRDYKGDITRVRDVNRSTIILNDPKQFNEVLERVEKQFGEPKRVKNKFNAVGYKSGIINVSIAEGITAEIQVTTPEMQRAKTELGGHDLYKKSRAKAGDIVKFLNEMLTLYEEADRLTSERLAKSSSEISSPSVKASPIGKGESSDVLQTTSSPSSDKETSTPSISKNRGSFDKKESTDSAISKPPSTDSIQQTDVRSQGQEPVGTGKLRESEAYRKVRERLDEATRQDVNYNRLNLEQDAKNAMEFVSENPKRALRIAKGLEAAPQGQTETAISIALADKAGRDENFQLQSDLEASRSLRQTRRGQEIVSERGRFNDNSPYRYIAELIDRRMKEKGSSLQGINFSDIKTLFSASKKKAMAKIDTDVEKVSRFMKKEQVKIRLAQEIIDSLKC